MTTQLPPCPQCFEAYTYEQGVLLVCPMCAHEWSAHNGPEETPNQPNIIKDAVGNELADGVGDHDIDANVPGFGRIQLKSSVVKKAL